LTRFPLVNVAIIAASFAVWLFYERARCACCRRPMHGIDDEPPGTTP